MNIRDYTSLLPVAHRDLPKFNAFLRSLLSGVLDLDALRLARLTAFDPDTAVGTQLDTLGALLHLSREELSASPLPDEDFRLALRGAILSGVWDGASGTLQPLADRFFPELSLRVRDDGDMGFTVLIPASLTENRKKLLASGHLLPVPAGVRLRILESEA